MTYRKERISNESLLHGESLLVLKEQIGNVTSACVRCRQTAYHIQAIVWPRAKPEILQQI